VPLPSQLFALLLSQHLVPLPRSLPLSQQPALQPSLL
jgi:hypothetical protein